MDCKSIKTADFAEKYLQNRLDEAEMNAFETHLLECTACRREIELLQSARADLAERAHEIRTWTPVKPFFLRWQAMGVAALVVVVVAGAVAGTFFFRGKKTEQTLTVEQVPTPTPPGPTNTQPPGKPKQLTVDGGDAVDNSVNGVRAHASQESIEEFKNSHLTNKSAIKKKISPNTEPTSDSGLVSGARGNRVTLTSESNEASGSKEKQPAEVAQLKPSTPVPTKEPPNKETPTLTTAQGAELYYLGSTTAPAFTFSGFTSNEQNADGVGGVFHAARPARAIDPRRVAFRNAMAAYLDGNYSDASGLLEQAALNEPGALDVQFYLGICRLLIGQPQRAIEPFTNAAKVNSPVLQQQAHYYLAKAYVQSLQLKEAEDEFRVASQLTGPLKNDASGLLSRLQALRAQLAEN